MSAAMDTRPGTLPAAPDLRARHAEAAWRWTAIVTIVVAGLLHLAAASEHVGHGGLVVGFFLLVAAGQVGGAAWLFVSSRPGLRTPPALIVAGLTATVALIGLYIVAHRTDLLAGLTGEGLTTGDDHSSGGPGHPAETTGAIAPGDQPVVVANPNLLGFATLAAEVVTVVALTALLPKAWRRRAVDILCALGALTWLLWLTGVLG